MQRIQLDDRVAIVITEAHDDASTLLIGRCLVRPSHEPTSASMTDACFRLPKAQAGALAAAITAAAAE